jgi:hypothetical protein
LGTSEVKGEGNSINYKYRMHDPRVGRFFAVDPLKSSYPWNSPYAFSENKVIAYRELEGLESSISIENNTYFVKLENASFSAIIRQSNEYFTDAINRVNDNANNFAINTQMFDNNDSYWSYYTAKTPKDRNLYPAQGYTIDKSKIISGRSSKYTFYFRLSSSSCKWSCGFGNPELSDSEFAFGGGTPLIVNGLKYGVGNIYKKGTPSHIAKNKFKKVAPENYKYLLQRNNNGFTAQNKKKKTVGKTILGYNSKDDTWIIVSQPNNSPGFSYTEIRDKLYNLGYDNVLGFDGSSSATLYQDGKSMSEPNIRKNSTIPAGVNTSVPNN